MASERSELHLDIHERTLLSEKLVTIDFSTNQQNSENFVHMDSFIPHKLISEVAEMEAEEMSEDINLNVMYVQVV